MGTRAADLSIRDIGNIILISYDNEHRQSVKFEIKNIKFRLDQNGDPVVRLFLESGDGRAKFRADLDPGTTLLMA